MKRGFTLIELMVVIAMIAIITAAFSTSVAKAQQRAKISRAQTEAREMTNAIRAFANYTDDGTLSGYEMDDAEADEGKLGFIFGKVSTSRGQVPVLFNGGTVNGAVRDPWGRPYRVTVKKGDNIRPTGTPNLSIRLFYPNWHRLTGGER